MNGIKVVHKLWFAKSVLFIFGTEFTQKSYGSRKILSKVSLGSKLRSVYGISEYVFFAPNSSLDQSTDDYAVPFIFSSHSKEQAMSTPAQRTRLSVLNLPAHVILFQNLRVQGTCWSSSTRSAAGVLRRRSTRRRSRQFLKSPESPPKSSVCLGFYLPFLLMILFFISSISGFIKLIKLRCSCGFPGHKNQYLCCGR